MKKCDNPETQPRPEICAGTRSSRRIWVKPEIVEEDYRITEDGAADNFDGGAFS